MSKVIGIDLGTYHDLPQPPIWPKDGPKLIPNAVGGSLTPSVVGLDEDGKLLGRPGGRGGKYRVTDSGPLCFSVQAAHGKR